VRSNCIRSRPPTARQSCSWPGFGRVGKIPHLARKVLSATLIVTGATEWMKPYHDRMPAVLAKAEIHRWLRADMSTNDLHPMSSRVNRTGFDRIQIDLMMQRRHTRCFFRKRDC
jgi:putative SOS response-associated peptidase YedK